MSRHRRTESARNLLVGLIRQVQDSSKAMMFRHIQEVNHQSEIFIIFSFSTPK